MLKMKLEIKVPKNCKCCEISLWDDKAKSYWCPLTGRNNFKYDEEIRDSNCPFEIC